MVGLNPVSLQENNSSTVILKGGGGEPRHSQLKTFRTKLSVLDWGASHGVSQDSGSGME